MFALLCVLHSLGSDWAMPLRWQWAWALQGFPIFWVCWCFGSALAVVVCWGCTEPGHAFFSGSGLGLIGAWLWLGLALFLSALGLALFWI